MGGRSWTRVRTALTVVSATLIACARGVPPPSFTGAPVYHPHGHFAVIGDLQRTLPIGVLLANETNDEERRLLLPELVRRGPDFVVMLGDLVSDGGSLRQWQEFDDRSAALRRMQVPAFAVPGNHEYLLGRRSNLDNFFGRFPHLQEKRWYARRYGPLALVFLDSNADMLRLQEWRDQRCWYEAALAEYDRDLDVKGVVVFLHHAPYTNSSLVGDNDDVRGAFVPAFLKAEKTMAMVTGHAHGYERFTHLGKAFIVSAGGGGPRRPLLTGIDRRHDDDEFPGPPLRNFNFVEFGVRASGLQAEVVGLPKDCRVFCRMEAFELKWPAGGPAIADGPSRPGPPALPACAYAQ